ncbi:lytic transglycosylase domain-containing protein [Notoacmeibacter ruber]|uniref:Lytic transglycosylase domain-containing protein n=1 Tax=Notoacmeibacter ruber TaxID=2670375 RepID=A0A3L7JA61_9HYPH|nr:lytic transglycosylase domain-containing protein [Notoacmeibacter ruber]RLQ87583.1 lytic transglycosylase domain-containing protein [Notoacmeibacter ruber]
MRLRLALSASLVLTGISMTAAAPAGAQVTSAIPPRTNGPSSYDPVRLKAGLDAVTADEWSKARQIRDTLSGLDREILTWAIAYYGGDNIPSAEIAAAAAGLNGWPGAERLRQNSERALASENHPPQSILAAFGSTQPETIEGAKALASAKLAMGDKTGAGETLAPLWRSQKMDASDEDDILRRFGPFISRAVHCDRMETMLYEDRVRSAGRVASLCGRTRLHAAFAAVTRKQSDAWSLLSAVPGNERTDAFYFAKARHLRWQGKFQEAAVALLEAPDNAGRLDPDAWWFERRVLSRELLDIQQPALAYRVVSQHGGGREVTRIDASFHAGWYALRFLNEPKRAANHFRNILLRAEGPISKARGYYWLGRAAEAGAGGDPRDYYRQAARYDVAFYGQLAAAKLGRDTLSVEFPKPTDAERSTFAQRHAVQAIARLEAAGHERRARQLYFDLARELTSPGELALLAVKAEQSEGHYLGLKVGKIAASRGLDIGALAHPIGAIPAQTQIGSADKALAYAVARQESEFNTGAVSHVGARGLLQLMPGTAKQMARKAGLAYSPQRLTSDAAYNTILGAHYLDEQLARFDGSMIMTFAGYNAGPSRAAEWAQRYGDPRSMSVEAAVDWVERIPYTETRNYVQRVMENYQVYRMRLSGKVQPSVDLTRGR